MNFETYFIRVLTPMHVGAGEGLGHIDLPIERETHTGFPSIQATAIKGPIRTEEILKISKGIDESKEKSLRNFAKEKLGIENSDELGKASIVEKILENIKPEILREAPGDIMDILNKIIFLADKLGSKDREGSLAFVDARILFFPIKSLKGIFALITCPYVLERFKRDTNITTFLSETSIADDECFVTDNSIITVNNQVVLEEFVLNVKERKIQSQQVFPTVDSKRVAIVHDDMFSHIVKNYTEIQTHIKVDIEKGTVEKGALWTEEYVPAETIFYFKVISKNGNFISMPDILQIGGNSSTGKGIVEVIKL